MIKKISCFIIICIFLSVSCFSFAESRMEEFSIRLTGQWKKINDAGLYTSASFGSSSFGSGSNKEPNYQLYNFRRVDTFSYPDNGRSSLIFLSEDSTGTVYLTISDSSLFCVGKIAFSEDGSLLLVIPVFGEGMAIYQKVR